jgi:hypothetical protein
MVSQPRLQAIILSGLGIILLATGIIFGIDAWASMQILETELAIHGSTAQSEYMTSARIVQASALSIGLGVIISIHGAIAHLRSALRQS